MLTSSRRLKNEARKPKTLKRNPNILPYSWLLRSEEGGGNRRAAKENAIGLNSLLLSWSHPCGEGALDNVGK